MGLISRVAFVLVLFVSHVHSFAWHNALHNLLSAQNRIKDGRPEARRWYPSTFSWRDRKNFASRGHDIGDPDSFGSFVAHHVSGGQTSKLAVGFHYDDALPEDTFDQPTDGFYPRDSMDNRISNLASADSLSPPVMFDPSGWASKGSGLTVTGEQSQPRGFSDLSSSFMAGPPSPQGHSSLGGHSKPTGFGWGEESVPAAAAAAAEAAEFSGVHVDPIGFSTSDKDCDTIETKTCMDNSGCECSGFYHCVEGRCRELSSSSFAESFGDQWHDGPAKTLGLSKRH